LQLRVGRPVRELLIQRSRGIDDPVPYHLPLSWPPRWS
jgi:hypothetical protein